MLDSQETFIKVALAEQALPLKTEEFEKEERTSLVKEGVCECEEKEIKKEINENRRKFFRIGFPSPLKSRVYINSFNGSFKKISKTEVLVEDIGPGGLKFLSAIKLPVRSDMVLCFELNLPDAQNELLGKVVRANEMSNGITSYGV